MDFKVLNLIYSNTTKQDENNKKHIAGIDEIFTMIQNVNIVILYLKITVGTMMTITTIMLFQISNVRTAKKVVTQRPLMNHK